MNAKPQATYDEAHRVASEQFRQLTPEQMRERLREAGVLGIAPKVGDKVRVLGRLDTWRYGIVLGADRAGRIHVAHDRDGVIAQSSLHTFAAGQRVHLVERPPEGAEQATAERAAQLVGKPYNLATFDTRSVPRVIPGAAEVSAAFALGSFVALAALGLVVAAVLVFREKEWDEATGRYRDSRGRFAAG